MFDILRILVENSGRLVTKDELIKQVWVNQFVEENNLTVRISVLRKTLGENDGQRFIETVSGYGYRFASRVQEISNHRFKARDSTFSSLAVLPLINENSLQRLNYLCDGITESLINSLSQLSALKVMSRSAVFRYKGKDLDPLAVGKELSVGAVLVGNLNQVSNYLLFNFEVIDVADGSQLWGAKYKRQASDLFGLQEEVVREVSESLRIKLNKFEEHRITKRYTDMPEAYHLYLKGRYLWNKRNVPGLKRSVDYFRRAIKKDPQYALAYVGLADAYRMVAGYGLVSPQKIIPKAKAVALRALEIDNQLVEAHVSLGQIKTCFEWDWQGAEDMYRRAIELSPNNASAHHYYSTLLARLGRLDEAVAEVRKAFEIDPLSLHIHMALVRTYYFAKQYDTAVEQAKEILEIHPSFGPANGLMGLVYLEQKNYAGAIEGFKKLISFSETNHIESRGRDLAKRRTPGEHAPDAEALGILGYAYGLVGEHTRAIKILNRLRNLTKKRYIEPHSLVLVYLGLNDKDNAFGWVEKALADRNNSFSYIKVWPVFNRLRNDSRYQELIKRMGLQ
jgi:TolB-like protein/Tfp pilus assembly protein PilF